MTDTLFKNALILDPEAENPEIGRPSSLLVREGQIRECSVSEEAGEKVGKGAEVIDLKGAFLAPGFIDVHHHGGFIFGSPQKMGVALKRSSEQLLQSGTTAFLPTTVAWQQERLQEMIENWGACADAADWPGAVPLGLHLEGPWINSEAAGAQPRDGIRVYVADEGRSLLRGSPGNISMVTLAPEISGADELVRELVGLDIVAALGHSWAEAGQVERAVELGARHVTHLFNAMAPLRHREPGLVGVALSDPSLSCDLICDGVHVDPRVVRLVALAKRDQLLLITDQIDLLNQKQGASFGSGRVIDDGRALRLSDGRLAGSSLRMDRALRNAQSFGAMSLLEAVAACSLRPARLLGLEDERGTLRPGSRADLVVLSATGDVLQTWISGRRVYGDSIE